jgi:hypothetical protein
MHRFMSAVERLKLATEKLRNLEGVEEALPQEYIPAAFVVEEATQALEQIHEDLYGLGPPPGTSSTRTLTEQDPFPDVSGTGRCTCPRCDSEGCAWCEPEEAGQPRGYRAA